MIYYKSLALLLFIIYSSILVAQENNPQEQINHVAEEIAEAGEGEESISSVADQLRILMDDPVNINKADENETSRLFFLTGFQVKAICDYVRNSGSIVSIYEIAVIPGFSREIAARMEPFITLEKGFREKPDSLRIRQNLLVNYSSRSSDQDGQLIGPPWKTLLRYRLNTGAISVGFTAEKDPGERVFSGKRSAPDFLSGYLSYTGDGMIKELIIGDFSARFGQGLALNSSSSVIHSLTSALNLSGREDLRPYTSADENSYFRGLAARFSADHTDLVVFGSTHSIDATLAPDENGSLYIKSLYITGLHNTASSYTKKDAARLSSLGGYLTYNTGNLRTGLLLLSDMFSYPLGCQNTDLQEIFDFRGRRLTIASASYSLVAGKFILSGEFAGSYRRSTGAVQTIVFRPDDRLMINMTGRFYAPYFTSFHGRSPGISSYQGNESTASVTVIYEAAARFFICAGAETRNFTWLRYRSLSPASSIEYEIKGRYNRNEKAGFEFLFRSAASVTDLKRTTGIPLPGLVQRQSVRLSVKQAFTEVLAMSLRIDYVGTGKHIDNGAALLEDIEIKLKAIPLTVWFRYCVFSTGSFASAVYTWEQDLLHSFSVPALYGRGSRMYIMIKISPLKNLDFRVKYGSSYLISKGKSAETDEFKFQLTARF